LIEGGTRGAKPDDYGVGSRKEKKINYVSELGSNWQLESTQFAHAN